MITATNITKRFRSGDSTVTAVDDVNFTIGNGKFVAILGKSGSGKSTLLALLGALDIPTNGKIQIDDHEITRLRGSALLRYRREKVGFVFQNYQLIPNLSALENVMLPLEFIGTPTDARLRRAQELLDSVGITGSKQGRRPARLSGGEQQRVAIARALANQPRLILADEPTGNLDSATGKTIIQLLHDLTRKTDTTVIVVTHDQGITKHADVVLEVKDGKVRER